jgi:bifunctional non-homologous end joining protein LigD
MTLDARRAILSSLLPELGYVRTTAPLDGAITLSRSLRSLAPLEPLLAFAAEHDIGGVVAKKKSAPYDPAKAGWIFVPSGIAPRSRATVDHKAPDARSALRKVSITNRQKIFWPDEGYTKGDLIDFYANVADVILPHVAERPLILVRYPDGIAGKSFFQWNVPPGMPPWVRTMLFREHQDGHRKRGFLIDDASTLLYIANLGCIPLHILASRVPDLDVADFATIDFDVKQSELRHAITLAKTLRGILEDIDLPGYCKTSGQTGLHVLIPLGPGKSFDTASVLAELLGRMLVEKYPEIATMERVVARRGAKVYVDTGQTGTTRAIVAPYSVRATPGATVSTPLAWDEVNSRLDPRAFTIKTVPERIAKKGDLMKGLVGATPDIPRAIARLAEIVPRSVRVSRPPPPR